MEFRYKSAALAFALAICAISSNAQDNEKQSTPKKNIFKINVTALPLSNYGLTYERVLNKKISIAIGYRTMPLGNVPLRNNIVTLSGGDANMQKTLDQLLLSNTAITPELRWYPGKKGYGRGFYMAPFARIASFHAEGVKIEFAKSTGGTDEINLSGDLKSTTFGLLIGAQWSLGKRICLDWQILGPHYGSGDGSLKGVSSFTLSTQEQTAIKDALVDVNIPLTTATSTVTSNSIQLNLSGPWAGIRAGISLGIKL
ncbi:MAG: DUF3575 domain-containing protein [Chitinophagaceae bacterium]